MRPRGVTILAVLWAIGGVIEIVSGAAMSFVLPLLPGVGEMEKAMSSYITVMYVVFGAIGLIVAYGLWTLRNWARILAIVLSILGIIGCAGGIYSMYVMQQLGFAPPTVTIVEYVMGAVIVVLILIIWYLVRVGEAFT
jgi:uncharacterized membrane protein (DUF2068 family)